MSWYHVNIIGLINSIHCMKAKNRILLLALGFGLPLSSLVAQETPTSKSEKDTTKLNFGKMAELLKYKLIRVGIIIVLLNQLNCLINIDLNNFFHVASYH